MRMYLENNFVIKKCYCRDLVKPSVKVTKNDGYIIADSKGGITVRKWKSTRKHHRIFLMILQSLKEVAEMMLQTNILCDEAFEGIGA